MISEPRPSPLDFTLATTDLLCIYREDPEAALHLMQALFLSPPACQLRRAMQEALGNTTIALDDEEYRRILGLLAKFGALRAVRENRVRFEELEQLTRNPMALEEIQQLVNEGLSAEFAAPAPPFEETGPDTPPRADSPLHSGSEDEETQRLREPTKPTGFVELYRNAVWNDLHRRLSTTRVLDEIVACMGWSPDQTERLEADLLKSLPNESPRTDDFLAALNHCLQGFARRWGLAPPQPIRPEDWPHIVERAVLREVLEEETESSIPWQVAFKQQVYAEVLSQQEELLTRLLTLELPPEYGQPAWFQDFRLGLVHRIRDRWKAIDVEGTSENVL